MPDREPRRLLILGGTGEARTLARELSVRYGAGLDVTTSLAGRTSAPAKLAGRERRGGFGGAGGLGRYLAAEGIDLVVDATHPFAVKISANARAACDKVRVPRLVVARPPWISRPGDRWHEVADGAAAARLLPQLGTRAFLTTGAQGLAPFTAVADIWFLVRLVETPPDPLPFAACEVVVGRGPFTTEDEIALMRRHRIGVLVSKMSGGTATAAKLDAARALDLPVVMLKRPHKEAGPCASGVAEAMRWIAARLEAAQA